MFPKIQLRSHANLIIPFVLCLSTLISRLPFRTDVLYHWDSVNFALSLKHYDVRLHQPHPPGYFLYSMLGKIFNFVCKDANTSLVWISLISGVLGVIVIYFVTLKIFNRPTALIASIFTLTSPLHWFLSEVALSYTLEFVMVTLLAWLAYEQMTEEKKPWVIFSFLLGFTGGIRQNDLIFFLPLWLICLYFLSWRQIIGSLLVLGATISIWFIPMVLLSGGWGGYMAALSTESNVVFSESPLFSLHELLLNGFRLGIYLVYGLLLMIIPMAFGLLKIIMDIKQYYSDRRLWLFSLWIIPSFLFYFFIHVRQPGHIFTFFPALLILSASAIFQLPINSLRETKWSYLRWFVILITTFNLSFFVFSPASLFESDRLPLQTPSINSLTKKDQFWQERIFSIRKRFNPKETVLFAGNLNFRHLDYYFGDYQLPGLSHSLGDELIEFPQDVNTFVIVDNSLSDSIFSDQDFEKLQLSNGDFIYYIEWADGKTARLNQNNFILE